MTNITTSATCFAPLIPRSLRHSLRTNHRHCHHHPSAVYHHRHRHRPYSTPPGLAMMPHGAIPRHTSPSHRASQSSTVPSLLPALRRRHYPTANPHTKPSTTNNDSTANDRSTAMSTNNSAAKMPEWQKPSGVPTPIRLLNSLTLQKEDFIITDRETRTITWYTCGPTVYDKSHMGHARTYVGFDIVRRIVEDYFQYSVLYIVNITDVDDKIIKKANRVRMVQLMQTVQSAITKHSSSGGKTQTQQPSEELQTLLRDMQERVDLDEKTKDRAKQLTTLQIAEMTSALKERARRDGMISQEEYDQRPGFVRVARENEALFWRDMRDLQVREPTVITRVTEYLPQIVDFVKKVIDNGFAYESNGSVYFDTRRFGQNENHVYGKLEPWAVGDMERTAEGEGEWATQQSGSEKRSSSDFALWKKSKQGEPAWDSPWSQGRPGWHIECFGEDTRILTNRGFLFIDQLEEAVKDGQPLLYACYDSSSAQVQYVEGEIVRPPAGTHKSLIDFTQTNEQRRWQTGSGAYGRELLASDSELTNHLTIRVTKEHDMYAHTGSYEESRHPHDPHSTQYTKHKASTLVGGSSRPIHMLACAENGVANTVDGSGDWDCDFSTALGMDSPDKVDAFLELYGFWLGDGSLSFNHGGEEGGVSEIVFHQVKDSDLEWLITTLPAAGLRLNIDWRITEQRVNGSHLVSIVQKNWVKYFFDEYSKKYTGNVSAVDVEINPQDNDMLATDVKSAKWFWWWVLRRLSKRQLRLVIRGLHRADEDWARDAKTIFTSSVSFRDELIIALLHAGYTTFFELQHAAGTVKHWVCHGKTISPDEYADLPKEEQEKYHPVETTASDWAVRWDEPTSTKDKGASGPSLNSAEVKEIPYTGRTWCVTVQHPDHLVFVQRAERDDHGVVTKAGRPIIIGQCSAMASHVVGKDMLDVHCGGIDLRFPHHDNELAQSEAHFENKQWVNYFMHAGHLHIDGLSMSKSKKNFITIHDALQYYNSRQIRMLFLLRKFNDMLDYSKETMDIAVQKERFFNEFFQNVKAISRELAAKDLSTVQEIWEDKDFTLHKKLMQTKREVHEALCDSFNTPLVMDQLTELVLTVNKYVMHDAPRAPLLREIIAYITHIFRVFGLIDSSELGFSAGGADGSSYENNVAPILDAFAQFRDQVRGAARSKRDPKEILEMSDAIRDDILPELGVRLEDRAGGKSIWKLEDKNVLLMERERAREEQQEKQRQKEALKKKMEEAERQKWESAKIAPGDMFKDSAKPKYTQFDADGVPTHFVNEESGTEEEVTKSQTKQLKKMRQKQEKLHQQYLKKFGDPTGNDEYKS